MSQARFTVTVKLTYLLNYSVRCQQFKKTRFPGLSCGIVCVIVSLAVLVELRLVTDTDRQTRGHG